MHVIAVIRIFAVAPSGSAQRRRRASPRVRTRGSNPRSRRRRPALVISPGHRAVVGVDGWVEIGVAIVGGPARRAADGAQPADVLRRSPGSAPRPRGPEDAGYPSPVLGTLLSTAASRVPRRGRASREPRHVAEGGPAERKRDLEIRGWWGPRRAFQTRSPHHGGIACSPMRRRTPSASVRGGQCPACGPEGESGRGGRRATAAARRCAAAAGSWWASTTVSAARTRAAGASADTVTGTSTDRRPRAAGLAPSGSSTARSGTSTAAMRRGSGANQRAGSGSA